MSNQEFYLTAGLAGFTFGVVFPFYRICIDYVHKQTGETKYFQSVFNWGGIFGGVFSIFPYIWHDGVNYLCTPYFILGNKIAHESSFIEEGLEKRVTETRQTFLSAMFFGTLSLGMSFLYKRFS